MTSDELICAGVCDLKDGNNSRGLKAETHMITGKVDLALREAEPEVLRQRRNTHVWCRYSIMPCVVLMYSLGILQVAEIS